MIITVLNRSQGNGKSAIKYLLSQRDHKGDYRKDQPEILLGCPELTKSIVSSLDFKHKYLSVVFSFRSNESFDQDKFLSILDRFHNAIYSGLSRDRVNYLAVRHEQHVHLLIPRTDLATGKYLNGFIPGSSNLKLWNTLNSVINYENGWEQVLQKTKSPPKCLNFIGKKKPEIINTLSALCTHLVDCGKVNSRIELIESLKMQGVMFNRIGKDYVSVKLDGCAKPIRLRGGVFNNISDYKEYRAEIQSPFTANDYKRRCIELSRLTQIREQFNRRYTSTGKDITKGEPKNEPKPRFRTDNYGIAKPNNQPNTTTQQYGCSNSNLTRQAEPLSKHAEQYFSGCSRTGIKDRENGIQFKADSSKSEACSKPVSSSHSQEISCLGGIASIEAQLRGEQSKLSNANSIAERISIQNRIINLLAQLDKAKIQFQEEQSRATKIKIR